jgi:ATP-dependent DNA ligase
VFLGMPFASRRARLEAVMVDAPPSLALSPVTRDPSVARAWLEGFSGRGIDGVVAKDPTMRYDPGKRAMTKVKLERTADCVVAGFRWLGDQPVVSSLLLGLYADEGGEDVLRHVGVVSSFSNAAREQLARDLAPRAIPLARHPWEHGFALEGGPMGRLKGAAGRWTPDLEHDWVPIAPECVCEVAFDQVDNRRFRHPARWRRWRPDRDAASCRIEQLDQPAADPAGVLAG